VIAAAFKAAGSCGAAGAFFLDVGISSTHHIARFWRLQESPCNWLSNTSAFGALAERLPAVAIALQSRSFPSGKALEVEPLDFEFRGSAALQSRSFPSGKALEVEPLDFEFRGSALGPHLTALSHV
jgi:hypothetical protein